MTNFQRTAWLTFTIFLVGGATAAWSDHTHNTTLYLPTYTIAFAAFIVWSQRKRRARNYRFARVSPGVVSSPDGFEVRTSSAKIEYAEADRVLSWSPATSGAAVRQFKLSADSITAWDAPYSSDPIPLEKKQEIARRVFSALVYFQLIDAGKIRPQPPPPPKPLG